MSGSGIVAHEVYVEKEILSPSETGAAGELVLETFWLAEPDPDGQIEMTLLGVNDEITGIKELVSALEFKRRFRHRPGYFDNRPSPQERLLQKIIAIAEGHYANREYHSAEYEFKNALKLDEDSVRANFGLGLTYMALEEVEKARYVFVKLAGLDAVYRPEHKHLFNEFGIKLRQLGLYGEALEHYHRALQISQDDEHLWFNLGRALSENGRSELAVRIMRKAMSLNPNFWEARQYLQRYLTQDEAAEPGRADGAPLTQVEPEPSRGLKGDFRLKGKRRSDDNCDFTFEPS